MNITEVQKAFNRLEPGQSPGQRTSKIVLLVLCVTVIGACIYYYRTKPKLKKMAEGKMPL